MSTRSKFNKKVGIMIAVTFLLTLAFIYTLEKKPINTTQKEITQPIPSIVKQQTPQVNQTPAANTAVHEAQVLASHAPKSPTTTQTNSDNNIYLDPSVTPEQSNDSDVTENQP